MAKAINWSKLKSEYITAKPRTSYKKLAAKYHVSVSSVKQKAKKENWVVLRQKKQTEIDTKVDQKTTDLVVGKEIDRIKRISDAADSLLEKIEESITQLNNHLVKSKRKIKTVEQTDCMIETVEETEDVEFITGDVDRTGLKLLVSSLKELKEMTAEEDSKKDNNISIKLNWSRE